MEHWDIIPFEGIGKLRFGTSRISIHTLLESNFSRVRKGGEPFEIDDYQELGMHLHYNEKDQLEFIETFSPCDPTYNGLHLLNNKPNLVLNKLKLMGHDFKLSYASYIFNDLGLALYIPYKVIEAVAVYPKGYYDE